MQNTMTQGQRTHQWLGGPNGHRTQEKLTSLALQLHVMQEVLPSHHSINRTGVNGLTESCSSNLYQC
jgi:hypothetical protein